MTKTPNQPERAVVFIDANNCYHAMKAKGVGKLGSLNYAKISEKLVGARDWRGTRFYVGQVKNEGNTALYNEQRSFIAWLQSCDSRISVHFGRLEAHTEPNALARRLKRYLADTKVRIDKEVFRDLVAMGNAYEYTKIVQEKAVDVALAVDLVMMAQRDEYDVAYVLSADGDFTPAVTAVRDLGKKVFAASPDHGAQIAAAAYKFIPLAREWFDDCFGS
jgi:uncharacterized LabA/DUF88 family protein